MELTCRQFPLYLICCEFFLLSLSDAGVYSKAARPFSWASQRMDHPGISIFPAVTQFLSIRGETRRRSVPRMKGEATSHRPFHHVVEYPRTVATRLNRHIPQLFISLTKSAKRIADRNGDLPAFPHVETQIKDTPKIKQQAVIHSPIHLSAAGARGRVSKAIKPKNSNADPVIRTTTPTMNRYSSFHHCP